MRIVFVYEDYERVENGRRLTMIQRRMKQGKFSRYPPRQVR